MLIGNKNDFAIEYSISDEYPKEMGYGRIWIKNEFLGTYNDLIYLNGYLLGILNEFKNAKELKDNLKHFTKEELFDLFFNGRYEHSDDYLISGSTFTDDFSIWSYRIDCSTYILWKVINSDFFEDLNHYGKDVFLKCALSKTINNVIAELTTDFLDKGIKT